jgi:ferredoxin
MTTATQNKTTEVPKSNESLPASSNGHARKLPKKRRLLAGWDKRSGSLRIGTASWTSGWRLGVQAGSTLLSLILGWQFWRFVQAATNSASGELPTRPPGVEGYLPISGLMGLVDWIYQGTLNHVHPAATALLLIFVGMSFLVRKAFCGWICPVGFISENLARLGQLIFRRNFRLPSPVDIPLRALKYMLLGFFIWAIFTMTPEALHGFITSPYNQISDVKMMMFFVNLGQVGGIVLAVLSLLSILIQGFWCRYLCPYGALLGFFSWASPTRVRRDPVTCTDCGLCDKVCPSRLPVMTKLQIRSVECLGCGDCVSSCPVKGALSIGVPKQSFDAKRLARIVVAFFLIGYVLARVGGIWTSKLTDEDYRHHIRQMESEQYGHPGQGGL